MRAADHLITPAHARLMSGRPPSTQSMPKAIAQMNPNDSTVTSTLRRIDSSMLHSLLTTLLGTLFETKPVT